MQSKTSCFNKTIFRKHITRFWPVWGAYLAIWLLALPVPMLSQRAHLPEYPLSVQQAVLGAVQTGVILSFIFSALMAMAVWSFLYNARSASGAACLPVTRAAQFHSAALAGLLPLAAANVVTFALTALAELSLGALHLPSLLTWLGATLLHLIFFYGFAAFCAMLTGSIIVLPAVYVVLNFVAAGAQVLLDGLVKFFLYGVPGLGGSWLYWLSPVIQMLRTGEEAVTAYDAVRDVWVTVGWRFTGWWLAGAYAVVGVLLLLAARALLRRRRMETAGDVVAVQVLKPVFRWCMGLFGGLCFADMMLYVFGLTGGPSQRAILLVTALYLIVGAFLGWFIAEMLIRRSFRVFSGGLRGWGGWALCCAVLLAGLALTETDVFGAERWQPGAERVESVAISAGGEAAFFDTPEGIAEAMALHRGIIDHKRAQDQCDQKTFWLRDRDAVGGEIHVQVMYSLKNGGMRQRSYTLPHVQGRADDAAAAQALLNRAEVMERRLDPPIELTAENVRFATVTAVMPATECAAAAGYDGPEEYVLRELAGLTPHEIGAMSEEARAGQLRLALEQNSERYGNYGAKYYDGSVYGDYGDYGDSEPLPLPRSEADWGNVWLNYTLELTAEDAWTLYSACIRPDGQAGALGYAWVLTDEPEYRNTAAVGSLEIVAERPVETQGAAQPVSGYPTAYYPATTSGYTFFTVDPSMDAARTNAFLAAYGVRFHTPAEIWPE